ncbi:MAG: LCP family protein [Chloroflexota bacterium]
MQQKSNSPIIPQWLVYLLTGSLIVSGIAVSLFIFWTVEAVMAAPINPLAEGQPVVSSDNQAVEPIIIEQTATPGPDSGEPVVLIGDEVILPTPDTQAALELQQTKDAIRGTVAASGRKTILVMGIDRRPGEEFRSLTDTMIVISIDPIDNTASIMNIPRDMYADIPTVGRARINTAFNWGFARGVGGPAGGASLAIQTVERNLAIKIDHYILLDFTSFIRAVDAIGGIEVNVPEDIYDATYPTMNYGYQVFSVPAGINQFDGDTALKYARTRHGDSDFGRSERQQQVIMAVRNQVLTSGADQLIVQLPRLYNEVSEGVRTDLNITDMLTLATLARDMPAENIKTVVLDYNHFYDYNANGQQVLILRNDAVVPIVRELFYD